MKRLLSFLILPCLLQAASCRSLDEPATPLGRPVTFRLHAGTKGSGLSEDAVVRAEIYVFDDDGSLDAHGSASGDEVTVTIRPGNAKTVYAIVNQATDCSDLEGVLNLSSRLGGSGFVMEGILENETFTSEGPWSISVKRHAAKISLGKITNALLDDALRSETLSITAIYLINAADGPMPFWTYGWEPSGWINLDGWTSTELDPLLYESIGTVIAPGSSLAGNHVFYCYPNPTPQVTRLVVEARIGSRTCYYPISFPHLASNIHYHIPELTLTREGSSHPYLDVDTILWEASMQVTPWIGAEQGSVDL